jgi:hypothetical protein
MLFAAAAAAVAAPPPPSNAPAISSSIMAEVAVEDMEDRDERSPSPFPAAVAGTAACSIIPATISSSEMGDAAGSKWVVVVATFTCAGRGFVAASAASSAATLPAPKVAKALASAATSFSRLVIQEGIHFFSNSVRSLASMVKVVP